MLPSIQVSIQCMLNMIGKLLEFGKEKSIQLLEINKKLNVASCNSYMAI